MAKKNAASLKASSAKPAKKIVASDQMILVMTNDRLIAAIEELTEEVEKLREAIEVRSK